VATDRLWLYAAVAGALALAGWIWALSNADMPGILWLLTVALTVIAIALAVYAAMQGRARGTDASLR
jgi:hypothetical protein